MHPKLSALIVGLNSSSWSFEFSTLDV